MTANVNPGSGIPYGVIKASSVPRLYEAIRDNGVNVRIRDRDLEITETLTSVLSPLLNKEELAEAIAEVISRCNEAENNAGFDDSEDTFEYDDPDGCQFRLSPLGGAPLIWCIKTDRISQAMRCSPCVPNAGDLDSLSEYGISCYGVPKKWLDHG